MGKGKTCIVLGTDKIGFSCFSDDCAEKTFADLLRLLHSKTGRWPKTHIWAEENFEELAEKWGGIEEDRVEPYMTAQEVLAVYGPNGSYYRRPEVKAEYFKLGIAV